MTQTKIKACFQVIGWVWKEIHPLNIMLRVLSYGYAKTVGGTYSLHVDENYKNSSKNSSVVNNRS